MKNHKNILALRNESEMILLGEILFILEQSHNSRNDISWPTKIDDIPENKEYIPRFKSAPFVKIYCGISLRTKVPLIFIK